MQTMSTKITIIVPVYNVESYLARCINSLIHQTMKEIQIILIDDGSTDKSPSVCDAYAEKDKRILVIHKENEGQGIARNYGLKNATGEYVCFLDSDDYYDLDTCKELYELMKKTKADMGCFGYQIETQEGQIVRVPNIKEYEYTEEAFHKEFALHYFGDEPEKDDLRGFSSCMSIFRRDIIVENEVCFPSEREYLSEDTIFSLRFCQHAKSAVTTSKIYYHYCQNPVSFSQAFHEERLEQTITFGKILDEWAMKMNIEAETEIRRAMYLWVNVMAYLRQGIRYYGQKSRKQEVAFVQGVCKKKEVREKLKLLKGTGLSKQQKLLLWLVLNKQYLGAWLLVAIRAKMKL